MARTNETTPYGDFNADNIVTDYTQQGFCSPIPLTPSRVTNIIRLWLANHLSGHILQRQAPDQANTVEDFTYNLGNTHLRDLFFQDGSLEGIVIDSNLRLNPLIAGRRPVLLIKRNSYKYERYVIGDGPSSANLQGERHFTISLIGSHTVFAITKTSAQVEILADEVCDALLTLSSLAPSLFPQLQRFTVLESGEVSILQDSPTDDVVVPITVGWQMTRSWSVKQIGRLLARFQSTLNPGRILE